MLSNDQHGEKIHNRQAVNKLDTKSSVDKVNESAVPLTQTVQNMVCSLPNKLRKVVEKT